MCCPLDCKPDLQEDDWTPCIDCMSTEERVRYRAETGDMREIGWVPERFYQKESDEHR